MTRSAKNSGSPAPKLVPPPPPLPLDRLLCLDLYSTSRAVIKAYRPYLEKLGLTYPQYLVMMALWENQQSPQGMKELAEKLALDSGTLSPLLKRLESAGLVTRTRSKEDEREVFIALTAQGAKLQRESLAVCQGMFPKFGMSEGAALDLQQVLRKVRGLMEEG